MTVMEEFLRITKIIKVLTKKEPCPECFEKKLSFLSSEIEDDYVIKHGGNVIFDVFCSNCKEESSIILPLDNPNS